MKFEYVKNYKYNELLRKSFNQLAMDVFEIDFEVWYANGFWDETYICHSLVENGKVISNVSITKEEMLLNGKSKKAIQIGTVMTDPKYRNFGLAKQLMENVLDEYEQEVDLIYLFPNETVMDFYPKFGFTLIADYHYSTEIGGINPIKTDWRKIDITDKNDLALLWQLASRRVKRSNRFDIINGISIFMWHCLNTISDTIYINLNEDIVVVFKENDGVIDLFEVVSKHPVILRDLVGKLTGKTSAKVIFHFTPDFEDIDISEMVEEKNEDLFIKPIELLSEFHFSHPVVAHT